MEKTNCTTCKKTINKLDQFSTGECVDCYEKHYDTLSDAEKKPDFTGTVNR